MKCKNTFAGFAEAFTIFAKYSEDLFPVCVEHDEIFAYLDFEVVSKEDCERLYELGWEPNNDVGGFIKFV